MVFAEMEYQKPYGDMHDELVSYLDTHFSNIESGHQGESWIWILDGERKGGSRYVHLNETPDKVSQAGKPRQRRH
jgi:hypothetical protein